MRKAASAAALAAPAALAGLLSLGLLACEEGPCGDDPNVLRGSVNELYDIDVDTVRARMGEDETVIIEYMHGEDVVAKVVADIRAFAKGATIPLTDGSVYRVTSPPTDFPEDIDSGAITFESVLEVGEELAGCWNVKFNMDDGSQRTLEGTFQTTLGE